MSYPFFFKYQQSGNDFVILDDRATLFPLSSSFISHICDRKFGVGADGLILLQNSIKNDFKMRIFNSDGNEAESCGNGICCLAKFIKDQSLMLDEKVTLELTDSLVNIIYRDNDILVQMGRPSEFKFNQTISIDKGDLTYHFMNTGVPHFVSFIENVRNFDLKQIGPSIRNHENFMPSGTNVNFAELNKDQEIAVRTYERGVEGETLACGTGACAVALIASFIYNLPSPIKICHPGGKLTVHFERNQDDFKNVSIVGRAEKVYSGQLIMNNNDGETIC